ncbi:hypothetical protein K435DRAFT_783557 [Dendrothele bispora CBS 962.96]|uniref:Uncharacterized protein n=1 Tax=Dendrothele bispora (strain CBS 962.96) TaxID=1314807 RepID=A0A4S8L9P3_DENBC|nr:hypothetical protein K435DRAFT_783557 [Dendrothele bispora CBS 962.96]
MSIERATSTPPSSKLSLNPGVVPARPSSLTPNLSGSKNRTTSQSASTTMKGVASSSLDLMSTLQRSTASVVKTRTGSVLSRGFILKTDFYPSGRALDLDLNVHGAPNFRAPKIGDLNVFGVAQPRTQGLRAILSILRARPGMKDSQHVVWFSTREEPVVYISGRPFVLRDASHPRQTFALSDRAENLEAIELRLKNDILQEAAKFGGIILTHNEVTSNPSSPDGAIVPTWTAVDVDGHNVRTKRELWEGYKEEGWNVEYHRIPISPDRPIEDSYLDAYLRVIKSADPLHTSLVFSCGMGAVRTTYAMVAACVVRRKQIMKLQLSQTKNPSSSSGTVVKDPFGIELARGPKDLGGIGISKSPPGSGFATPVKVGSGATGAGGADTPSGILHSLEQASAQQDLSRSLLRLMYLLQQCLEPSSSTSSSTQSPFTLPSPNVPSSSSSSSSTSSANLITLLITHPTLLDSLRKAYLGNYGVILSLLGCLEDGLGAKRVVDKVVDANDHVVNLRESILVQRVRYALAVTGNGGSGSGAGGEEATGGEANLTRAGKALEKYFFMIAFASYVETSDEQFSQSFSEWLMARPEIWNQIQYLRKSISSPLPTGLSAHGGNYANPTRIQKKLNLFTPVHDLSALSASQSSLMRKMALVPGKSNDWAVRGEEVSGEEYEGWVVKNRRGVVLRESTLLKSDQWFRARFVPSPPSPQSPSTPIPLSPPSLHHTDSDMTKMLMLNSVRGATNFRKNPNTNIYALGQPTIEAVDEVVTRILDENPGAKRVLWITLREEPIVYINGAPYCLRREGWSLRNMKDYGGISKNRLEVLEERLRDDVISEVAAFGGRLLLHTETDEGEVVPVWEEVGEGGVMVLRDIMEARKAFKRPPASEGLVLGTAIPPLSSSSISHGHGHDVAADDVELIYDRIPITSERPPDFTDLQEMIDVVLRRSSSDTPIVVNCQLGRGRSTLASIILTLIRRWLETNRLKTPTTPKASRRPLSMAPVTPITPAVEYTDPHTHVSQPQKTYRRSYQIINNLLRVIRTGLAVKDNVDAVIDQCAVVLNLRDSIEDSRVLAEQASDEKSKRAHAQKALANLRRYFELVVFQAYLQSMEPNTMQDFETFETFVKNRPVIKTFEKELIVEGINALKPLERADILEGVAHPDEVQQVVKNRSGTILSASTILKSDFFSNLQKMTLPERIEGSPNFRRLPLTLKVSSPSPASDSEEEEPGVEYVVQTFNDGKMVCGSGMPTVDGLRRALYRVDAGPEGTNKVFWTSLREEPVIYVAGRPHVLRLVDKPLENVEATGVTTSTVEAMEQSFKKDVLRELRAGNGRILLHDEVEERPGVFSIIPIWETVSEDDILTPRDVFELMAKEKFKIDYGRVAITDEQAPLPGALSQLLDRVRSNLDNAGDFIFNCQMGRGRTTTGMVTACLISTTMNWDGQDPEHIMSLARDDPNASVENFDSMDGPSEEEAYRQGEYKTILQLVGVLSHGKVAKRLTDKAIDLMQDVQNLRKAIYDYKLKVDACERDSKKEIQLRNLTVNYLYRYGTLIVFANYLIEMRERVAKGQSEVSFQKWLEEHREITNILGRRSLD